ncbi:MAG TPA: caspase family protein [Steroidobacteraceae bacterium]
MLTPAAPAQARRLALVIGNDSYQHVDPLGNARADATAVANALTATHFKVTLKKDLTLTAMKDAMRAFKNDVAGGDEVIFYYAGHGVQLDGNNFIIPVDAIGESADQLKDYAVPLQRVLDDMQDQKARFTLAIVDACRNNPFKGNGRALRTRGLAPVQAADGQAVLYSAGAGQEALDNLGPGDKDPNGVFTRVLIKEMLIPGLAFDDVIHQVRNQVVTLAKSVNQDQTPGYYSQFTGDFFFVQPLAGKAPAPAPAAAPALTQPSAAANQGPSADEIAAYQAADKVNSADGWRIFLKNYPRSAYATTAQIKLNALTQPPAPAAMQPTQPAQAPAAAARSPAASGARGPVDPQVVGTFELDGVADDYDQHYSYTVTADGHFRLLLTQEETGTYQGALGTFRTKNSKSGRVRVGTYRAMGNGVAVTNSAGVTALYQPLHPTGPINPLNPSMLGEWRASVAIGGLNWTLTVQNNPNGTFSFRAQAEDNGTCGYANNQWHWASAVTGQTDAGTYRVVDAHSVEFSGQKGSSVWRRL